MTKAIDDIWAGDSSGRSGEALTLQQFITSEIASLKGKEREQSYVLALDAAYGEGKTWFLERFRRQLALKHPVAFIDAWVDESNDEPLTAFMAAIEDALEPYLSKGKKLREKLGTVKRSALPAMGRMATGALSKAAQKYMGDAIGDDLDDIFNKSEGSDISSGDTEAASPVTKGVEGLIEQAGKEVSSIVDKRGAVALAAYRKQKKSRELFRENMCALIEAIDVKDSETESPLFIVIDELDRCRPDYAIRLLEEIKHFFDVPGVAFVIALHGEQLTKSINAVYGPEFDSASYLRRFFSRRYEMRRLSVAQIVAREYSAAGFDDKKFFVPNVLVEPEGYVALPATEFIGRVLDALRVTPRETFPIMDGLRMFHDQWTNKIPIELVALLPMLTNMVKGKAILTPLTHSDDLNLYGRNSGIDGGVAAVPFHEAVSAIFSIMGNPLPVAARKNMGGGMGYAGERFSREFSVEYKNSHPHNQPPHSVINQYADVVRLLSRFTDDVANEYLASQEKG